MEDEGFGISETAAHAEVCTASVSDAEVEFALYRTHGSSGGTFFALLNRKLDAFTFSKVTETHLPLDGGVMYKNILLPIVARPAIATKAQRDTVVGTEIERDPLAAAKTRNTILVADDERVFRPLIERILKEAGFDVLTAKDGYEAVELFQAYADEIACVLLDLTMPKMNGDEAFEAIRRIRPDARVILSSGYCEEDVRPRFNGKSRDRVISEHELDGIYILREDFETGWESAKVKRFERIFGDIVELIRESPRL